MSTTHLSDLEILADLFPDALAIQSQLLEIAKESVSYANQFTEYSYDKKSKQITYHTMRRGFFVIAPTTIKVPWDFNSARWRTEFVRRCSIQRFVENACNISTEFDQIYRTELIQKMEVDLVDKFTSGCVELPCISLLDFPKFIYAEFINHLAEIIAEQLSLEGIP